jgi:hypothetical protein
MGYIRKALSITTLGLSNLVLDDDSKPAASATKTRSRPPKRPKTTAKAKTARARAGTSRPVGENTTERPKSRSARAKPKAAAGRRPATTARPKAKRPRVAQAKRVAAPQPRAEAQPKAEAAAASTAVRPGAPTSGVAIALDRLAKLHDHGALTDREFAAAKGRILGTGPPEADSAAFPAIEANVAAARRLAGYAEPDREPSAPTPGVSRGI